MPEGRAQRGRSRIRHAESIDGAEHRVKLSNVMAADHWRSHDRCPSMIACDAFVESSKRIQPRPRSCHRSSPRMGPVSCSATGALSCSIAASRIPGGDS